MILLVLLSAACGADSDADADANDPPTTTEATTPPEGGWTFVHGTGNCDCGFGTSEEDGDTLILTGTCGCEVHASDPRVSGSEALPMTLVMFPGSVPEVHWFEYDTATLTTDLGTWRDGVGFGSEFFSDDDLLTSGYTTYVGEGAFEGLTYEYFFAQSGAFTTIDDPHESYRYSGWIRPTAVGDGDR